MRYLDGKDYCRTCHKLIVTAPRNWSRTEALLEIEHWIKDNEIDGKIDSKSLYNILYKLK